ncbi:SAM-dependent methyltransferase [Archangium violaceum]|nr:SAM-dependent methyltransferase [Archangium violaceum]
MNPVATTGLLVASIRSEESLRPDRLFEDPFAAALSGDEGRAALAAYRAAVGPSIPIIEVRTRFFDEAITRASTAGVRQFVILAAGMDARAYRLSWAEKTRVFEVDQSQVMTHKERTLEGVPARCARVSIASNLADDWPRALAASGHDARAPTCWLVEGLLQYLEAGMVEELFARMDALSSPRSRLLYDVVGRTLLASPMAAPVLRFMNELGAPWRYGTDQPATLVEGRGWQAALTDPARIGAEWGRWPFPPGPSGAPGFPLGALVEATKEG